jgi:hypothetical protein
MRHRCSTLTIRKYRILRRLIVNSRLNLKPIQLNETSSAIRKIHLIKQILQHELNFKCFPCHDVNDNVVTISK